MRPTPFDPATDLPPVPFEDRCLELARALRDAGLDWRPHVGCFVWDPEGCIDVESPFPARVYFILNLGRFLQIFESIETMKQKLVWLPTWYQARLLCQRMGIAGPTPTGGLSAERVPSAAEELASVYEAILRSLRSKERV